MKVVHGGNIHKVARELGLRENQILDFSANINPLGIPRSLKEAIINRMDEIENYPDPDYCMLVKGISDFLNIDRNYVIPGNGATELIFLALNALKPKDAMVLAPTFGEYERALKKAGAEVHYHNLNVKDDFKVNIKDLLEEAKEMDVLVICNPNNPTGQMLNKDEMRELIEGCSIYNTFLFIDEAFVDFTMDESMFSALEYIKSYKDVFILRAFTKFFAIPGLRLGFGLTSNKALMEKMQAHKEPWSINTFADIAGQVLLEDKEYIHRTKAYIQEEAKYLYNGLKRISRLKVYEPSVNYIFIGLHTPIDLVEPLLKKGIMIRSCSNYNNLDDRYYRVAVKDRESNIILIKALEEALNEG